MQKIIFSSVSLIMLITGLVAFNYQDGKQQPQIAEDEFVIDTLATGLTVPWSMVFIDKETLLFSERNGKLRLLRKDQLLPKPVLILRQIDTTRKMGLLGICLHPDFANNQYLYISYNYSRGNTPFLRVVRYSFGKDTLLNPVVIIDSINGNANHSGCRLKFGPDTKLYITTGDADRPILAQDLKSLNGKILRVNDDGSIPAGNPFINNDTARKEIWSYGHRNTQGIDFQPSTGDLYNSEHGPTGGDEINIIKKGLNYGWPMVHHRDVRENMESPLLEFTPSIAPGETLFYNGNAFPSMKGNLLVACLRGEAIMRIEMDKQKVISREDLLLHRYGRIRAITISTEGFIYFSTSQNDPPEGKPRHGYDMICRIRPLKDGNVLQANANKKVAAAKRSVRKKNSSNSLLTKSKSKAAVVNKPKPVKTTGTMYIELCAACHGSKMQGTDKAKSFLDNQWVYGSGRQAIIKSISNGIVGKGMPAWQGALTENQISDLCNFIMKGNVSGKR